jgi:hypothetical protein
MAIANLHSTAGHHLLPQVILVLANGALPPCDGLVLANQNLFGDLVKQSGKLSVVVDHEQLWTYLKS